MRAVSRVVAGFFGLSTTATAVAAQDSHLPIRPLGPVVARVQDSLQSIAGIHVLHDGRVLVNDRAAKRIAIYDSNLTHPQSVGITYPMALGKIFGYSADTTLFLDPQNATLGVIDPRGAIVRTIPLPTTGIQGGSTPATSWSAGGRIVYEAPLPRRTPAPSLVPGSIRVDSILLLSVDVASGRIDTLTRLARAASGMVLGPGMITMVFVGTTGPVTIFTADTSACAGSAIATCSASSGVGSLSTTGMGAAGSVGGGGTGRRGGTGAGPDLGGDTALFTKSLASVAAGARLRFDPAMDAWVVLPDGSVAVVRGDDSRIDFHRGGTTTTTPLPESFVSAYLTPEQRLAFVDSLKRYYAAHPEPSAKPDAVPPGMKVVFGAPVFPDPASLPAHTATFALVRADTDGHLWIQEMADPSVWGVVTQSGQLIDRVRIPAGMTIESFGPGVVYLIGGGPKGITLAKARIR